MMRIVFENVFFFLLPTLFYIAWVAFSENEWAGLGAVLRRAPLLALFVAGAALMLTTLILFSSRSHNSPHDAYAPPSIKDGRVEPGHSIQNEIPTKP